MFDTRIKAFAEEKFQRDCIDMKLGSMVTQVTGKKNSTKEKGSGEIKSMPYGMCLWSTGIGPCDVFAIKELEVGMDGAEESTSAIRKHFLAQFQKLDSKEADDLKDQLAKLQTKQSCEIYVGSYHPWTLGLEMRLLMLLKVMTLKMLTKQLLLPERRLIKDHGLKIIFGLVL